MNHPLPIGTTVTAKIPSCPCRNAKIENVTGKILKVITNQSGIWYYLDIGRTVRASQVG